MAVWHQNIMVPQYQPRAKSVVLAPWAMAMSTGDVPRHPDRPRDWTLSASLHYKSQHHCSQAIIYNWPDGCCSYSLHHKCNMSPQAQERTIHPHVDVTLMMSIQYSINCDTKLSDTYMIYDFLQGLYSDILNVDFLRRQKFSFKILRKKKWKNITKNHLICVKIKEKL